MPREVISTPDAPEYPSYSRAVKIGNTIYVAGSSWCVAAPAARVT